MYRNNLSEKSKEYIMNYIKAELIIWYQDHAGEFLLQRYLKYKNLFIQRYYKRDFLNFAIQVKMIRMLFLNYLSKILKNGASKSKKMMVYLILM